MKILTAIAATLIPLAAILTITTASPHPGRTDASGCHTNRSTGNRHCHNQKKESDDGRVLVTVRRIADGDTVEVEQNGTGQTVKVRMVCVDAPELSQGSLGDAAAKHLAALLPIGGAAQLRVIEEDRFGRTVAEIYRDGRSVNLQMVRDGQAVVFRQYLDNCADTREQYLQNEAAARAERRGYWNQSSPVMPWDWRNGKRCNGTGPECWVH